MSERLPDERDDDRDLLAGLARLALLDIQGMDKEPEDRLAPMALSRYRRAWRIGMDRLFGRTGGLILLLLVGQLLGWELWRWFRFLLN